MISVHSASQENFFSSSCVGHTRRSWGYIIRADEYNNLADPTTPPCQAISKPDEVENLHSVMFTRLCKFPTSLLGSVLTCTPITKWGKNLLYIYYVVIH